MLIATFCSTPRHIALQLCPHYVMHFTPQQSAVEPAVQRIAAMLPPNTDVDSRRAGHAARITTSGGAAAAAAGTASGTSATVRPTTATQDTAGHAVGLLL